MEGMLAAAEALTGMLKGMLNLAAAVIGHIPASLISQGSRVVLRKV